MQLRGVQTTSALRLIMPSSKTENKTSSAASAVWPVETKCCQYTTQHGAITIVIDCNGLSLLIFEEKWLNYASGPKFTSNSDSFFCAPNATILLVYTPAKIKMSFISKDDFFCQNRHLSKLIAGPLSKAYTQLYLFGGRIILIICQIRQELSVSIHKISTSRKNKRLMADPIRFNVQIL